MKFPESTVEIDKIRKKCHAIVEPEVTPLYPAKIIDLRQSTDSLFVNK